MIDIDLNKYSNKNWVIALSGGADSRLLLELCAMQSSMAKSIKAIYVHHHLQSVADEWAVFCRNECKKLGVTCYVEDVHVDAAGSIEANAREARYKALSKYITSEDDVLFTAHHADDLLESVLLALVRGVGIEGLTAMPMERTFAKGLLARPLMNFSRQNIEDTCAELNISYVTDPTNKDIHYDRNYLRNEVTPLLKKRFPQIVANTCRTIQNIHNDKIVLHEYLEQELKNIEEDTVFTNHDNGIFAINYKNLKSYSEVYQYALLRFFLKKRYQLVLSKNLLTEILNFYQVDEIGKVFVKSEDYIISLYRDYLYVCPDLSFIEKGLSIKIDPSVEKEEFYSISNDKYTLSVNVLQVFSKDFHEESEKQNSEYYFVTEEQELVLEFLPATSLRCHPQSRVHSQTLKNLWKEYCIPVYLRPLYPVISVANDIQGIYKLFKNKNCLENGKLYLVKLTIKLR